MATVQSKISLKAGESLEVGVRLATYFTLQYLWESGKRALAGADLLKNLKINGDTASSKTMHNLINELVSKDYLGMSMGNQITIKKAPITNLPVGSSMHRTVVSALRDSKVSHTSDGFNPDRLVPFINERLNTKIDVTLDSVLEAAQLAKAKDKDKAEEPVPERLVKNHVVRDFLLVQNNGYEFTVTDVVNALEIKEAKSDLGWLTGYISNLAGKGVLKRVSRNASGLTVYRLIDVDQLGSLQTKWAGPEGRTYAVDRTINTEREPLPVTPVEQPVAETPAEEPAAVNTFIPMSLTTELILNERDALILANEREELPPLIIVSAEKVDGGWQLEGQFMTLMAEQPQPEPVAAQPRTLDQIQAEMAALAKEMADMVDQAQRAATEAEEALAAYKPMTVADLSNEALHAEIGRRLAK